MRTGVNLVILFFALVMGGVAAYLTHDWLSSHSTQNEASVPTQTVVVAAEALNFGVQITSSNVTEIHWPSDSVPEGSFRTVEDLIKSGRRMVLTPLVRNEPIVASKITPPGGNSSLLSSMIEGGKRAVTVPVDDVRGVAGFIFPNDFVDIVLTRANNNDSTGNFSEIILQHVKVLAIDQLSGERQERPTVAKAVTLELTSEQALKILLATNVGKLSLILRQSGDETGSGGNKKVTEQDLFDAASLPAAIPAPSPPQPESSVSAATSNASAPPPTAAPIPSTQTITIFRGVRRDEYQVPKEKP